MVKNVIWVFSLAALTASPVLAQEWAQKMFETKSHDFGTVPRGAKAEYAFVMENKYAQDVHIAGVHVTCGCTTPSIEKPLLKTYEQGAIVAEIDTHRFLGHQSSTITVTIDKPSYAVVQLHVRVQIRSDVEFNPATVAFGNVDQGVSAEKTVTVTSTQSEGWKILEVKSTNPHLSGEAVEITRDGNRVAYKVRARLDEKAPAGNLRDHLLLVTNDASSKEIFVTVEGQVVSELSVSPPSLFLGATRPGDKVRKRLVVRGKKPFTIRSITADCECFEFSIPADGKPKALYVIPVSFVASDKPGAVVKTLRIETDGSGSPAEVKAYALVKE